jgi:hypothetical protein
VGLAFCWRWKEESEMKGKKEEKEWRDKREVEMEMSRCEIDAMQMDERAVERSDWLGWRSSWLDERQSNTELLSAANGGRCEAWQEKTAR